MLVGQNASNVVGFILLFARLMMVHVLYADPLITLRRTVQVETSLLKIKLKSLWPLLFDVEDWETTIQPELTEVELKRYQSDLKLGFLLDLIPFMHERKLRLLTLLRVLFLSLID